MNTKTDAPEIWQVGDVILDLYEIKQQFNGGMGLVHRVFHRNWKTDLAVKSPKKEYFETEEDKHNFINEAETWVSLGLHPHIVSCYYVRTLGGIPRVFAEYVEGGTLTDWIRLGKLYEGGQGKVLERILNIAIQVSWGLQYAHEQGLIHQDVKPANVMVRVDGVAKILDFGLAKARAVTSEKAPSPQDESFLATYGGYTPAYCSLEQAYAAVRYSLGNPQKQQIKLSRKTDIWSLGITIWAMFYGKPPTKYGGQLAAEVFADYLQLGKGTGLVAMPAAVIDLLWRCFQTNPTGRPSAKETAEALQQIYEQEIGQPYSRQIPKAVELKADSLNNRAISYLDLGREDEAIRFWEDALQKDPQHLEATFNLGYLRRQKGEIGDDVYVKQMQGLAGSKIANPAYWLCLGWIHYERGDREAVEAIQQSEYRIEDEKFKKALEMNDRPTGMLLRVFEGHTGHINSVSYSPNGRYALSGSSDKTMRLWDVETGQEIRCFTGHTASINYVCFSSDGQYALSGSEDHTLRLWDIETGKEVRRFKGSTYWVNSISFSPDGRYALSSEGIDDSGVQLWDVETGCEVNCFEGHTSKIHSVSFSPNGRYALSGSRDNTLRLWDVETSQEIRCFEGHTGRVYSVGFSPDGRYVVSGSEDHTLRLWDVETGREIRHFEGHTSEVYSVGFSPNGQFVLSGGRDNTLRLWDVKTGREVRRFEGHTEWVNSVSYSPDGCYVLSGGSDHTLRQRRLDTLGKRQKTIPYYPLLCRIKQVDGLLTDKEEATKLLRLVRESMELGCYRDAYLGLRKVQCIAGYERDREVLALLTACGLKGRRTGLKAAWQRRLFEGHTQEVESVSFSSDGHYALSGSCGTSWDRPLRLWDVETGREIRHFEGHQGEINTVSFSPNGRYALSGGSDKTVRLWDVQSGEQIKCFEQHTDEVWSVSFSADGQYGVSGSTDHTLRLWDLEGGDEIRRFLGHSDGIYSVSFSPDGLYVLSGSWDRTLKIWNVETGHEYRRFEGHNDGVYSARFSADGRYVISGSNDGTLRLWSAHDVQIKNSNIERGRELRVFEGHNDGVTSVSFSPDRQYALSGSWDKTIRLWDMQSGEPIRSFEGHNNSVISVCFSSDGRYALSGSWDKTMRLWEFDWEWEF